MSWNMRNAGTKEAVVEAIDEHMTNPSGMPADVGIYLKAAVAALDPGPGYLVLVESSGHRPLQYAGSVEVNKVEIVKSGPFNPKG